MRSEPSILRDFTVDRRVWLLSGVSIAIGSCATVLAVLLLRCIALSTNLFYYHRLSLRSVSPAGSPLGHWMAVVPVLGGLIVGLMARFGSDKIRGHGIPEAIEAILLHRARVDPKIAVLKPVSAAIAIGSGGPFGAEGPIIMTGGAVGSFIGQWLRVTDAERTTLLVAGAAAGMSATFATPVAAILLAVELLLFEWRPRSLVPVAVASTTAALLRVHWLGAGPLFPMPALAGSPHVGLVLGALLLGAFLGLVSAGMSRMMYAFEDLFEHLHLHWMWWPAIGGIGIGVGGLFFPRGLGVGYDNIAELLRGNAPVALIVGILVAKSLMWAFSLGSGTSGGVLAPLLMMGAGLGVALGHFMPVGDPMLWPLVCMAATLGGTMRAPLTATVFAFGLTHDANALLPLLMTSAVAYGFTVLTMRRSILTEKIARRGHHIYREYGVDPLERQFVEEVMTQQPVTLDAALSIHDARALHFGAGQAHRAFPVVRDGVLVGMIDREMLGAHGTNPGACVGDVCRTTPTACLGENCRRVATRMARHRLERLPVVREAGSLQLVGIVARSDLIKPSLTHFDEEEKRERVRGLPWQAGH